DRAKRRGADDRLMRGYGPLVGMVAVFAAAALLAPTVAREHDVVARTTVEVGAGTTAGVSTAGGGGTAGSAGRAGSRVVSGGGVTSCPGAQVPGDPYSPACAGWSGGDNGGATSVGVTASTITFTYRETDLPNIGALVAQMSNGKLHVNETQADLERTLRVMTTYFNNHFQFYGRKLQIKIFHGQGSLANEALGGGQDAATADAIQAAQQEHAFGDLSGLTEPYAEALTAHHVMDFDPLYMSAPWFTQRDPYAWSVLPDCTKVATAVVDFGTKMFVGRPADYAGGDLKGKPRRIGIVAPDNPVYQSCEDTALRAARAAGLPIADHRSYPLSIDTLQSNAQTLVSEFQNEGITTIVLANDPITTFFMTADADQAGYFPEWVLTGVGFSDADYVGQLMDQKEWTHAAGISFLGPQLPERAGPGYAAYRSVDPNTDPDPLMVDPLFYAGEQVAIGLQMAGPNLTPETFAAGMRRYHGGPGEAGTWAYPGGDHSAPQAARIIWWNPTKISPFDNQPGVYESNGLFYPIGGFPTGTPPLFLDGRP
ncbi:MAG: ABC transporter substrate-binding protein, partial [Acidimicrobiales bacterium]